MDKRLTVLVVSCDKYKDIVEQYLYYLRLNWSDCQFPIAVAMEESDIDFENVRVIKCGKGVQWTKEVLIALDQIDSERVLLTVDDLFISQKVDNIAILYALDFMIKNDIGYYRIPKFQHRYSKKDLYPGEENIARIRKDKVYSVTIGSAMWKTSELKKFLGDGTKTAWELEEFFTKSAVNASSGYFDSYVTDTRPLLHCAHMVTAGKWIPSGLKDMKKQGYQIDTSTRETLSKKETVRMSAYAVATAIVPKKLRRPIKMFFSKFGFKFATKY